MTKDELRALFDARKAADLYYRSLPIDFPGSDFDTVLTRQTAWQKYWSANNAYLNALRDFIEAENPGVLVNIRQDDPA